MDIIADQEKEAKKLGIKLEDEEGDETVNDDAPDDSKESEEEKAPKKNQEDDSKADDKKEDEEESEDDDKEEKPQAKTPPKGSLQQEAFRKREQQRLEGIVASQLGPIAETLKGVTEALAELKTAKTPEAKQEAAENVDDELQKIADAEKIPIDRLKQIIGLAGKASASKIEGLEKKIEAFEPIITQRSQQEQQQQAEKIFGQEWDTQAEPILTTNYANANPAQLKEAKTLLAQLAMSADYGDTRGNKDGLPEHPAYPVDYIIYKEADKFDTILRNPKKKSFESSSSITDEANDEGENLSDLLDGREYKSAKEAIAADKKIQKAMSNDRLVVRRGGEQVDVTD